MWGNKKSHTPQAADPEPKNWQTNQPPKPAPASWERTTKMNKDVMRPAGATADGVMARLGSSLHVKGEISGNEDLYIDGTVEGAVQLDEGKLTVEATANVTADIIAREVVVCGKVRGKRACERQDRDQEGRFGDWGFDDGADHHRRRRVL